MSSAKFQFQFQFQFDVQPEPGPSKLFSAVKSIPGMTMGGRGPFWAGGFGGSEAATLPAGCDPPELCVVELEFAAVAPAELPFVCTITGLAPGLFTAIGAAIFTG